MSDKGLCTLAGVGCGARLSSLTLHCAFFPSYLCACHRVFIPSFVANEIVDLEAGVTDEGLRALAQAGCGARLTSLSLIGECFLLSCFFAPS